MGREDFGDGGAECVGWTIKIDFEQLSGAGGL